MSLLQVGDKYKVEYRIETSEHYMNLHFVRKLYCDWKWNDVFIGLDRLLRIQAIIIRRHCKEIIQ